MYLKVIYFKIGVPNALSLKDVERICFLQLKEIIPKKA